MESKPDYSCKIVKLGRKEHEAKILSALDLVAAADGLHTLAAVANNMTDPAARKVLQARIRTMAGVFKFCEKLLDCRLLNGGNLSDGLFFGTLEPNQAFIDAFYPGLKLDNVKVEEKSLTGNATIN